MKYSNKWIRRGWTKRAIPGLVLLACALTAAPLPAQTVKMTATAAVMQTPFGPTVGTQWQKFTLQLSAGNFNVTPDEFAAILANVRTFRIRTEMSDSRDIAGLDSVRVGNRFMAAFTSGTEEWSAAGDGTMEWKSSGGMPGGYLQISDWGSGDWHWAVAPAAWAGDWSGLKDSTITFFFKTDHNDYAALIEIGSAESTQLFLTSEAMTIPVDRNGMARVSLPAAAAANVVITLTSSDPNCLRVPESVTVSRSYMDVEFSVYTTATSSPGCAAVITAHAEGYQSSSMTLNVGKPYDASKAGTLEGRVTDAISKEGIPGAVVWVAGKSTTTDAQGRYIIEGIATNIIAANFSADPLAGKVPLTVQFNDLSSIGSYSMSVAAEGYMGTESLLSFEEGESKYVEISLTPIIKPGEMRLILNWGSQPRDLDLHLRTPVIEGRMHEIYWDNTGSVTSAPFVFLDVDHQEGYGPETITISSMQPGSYRCYVENYSTIPELSGSRAQVQIYTSAGLLKSVPIPTSGTGLFWHVCDIDGATGAVTVRNVIQNSTPGMVLAASRPKSPQKFPVIGSGGIISWSWDFESDLYNDSYSQNPLHTYYKPGLYSVTLKVSDGSREYQAKKQNYITALPEVITDVSWSRQYSTVAQDLFAVFAYDTLRAWAAGAGGTLLITTDGGISWNAHPVAAQFTIRDLHFVTPQTGLAVGHDSKQNAVILKTTDGGLTWNRVLSSSTARLYSLDPGDALSLWAAGHEGKIERTTNGGTTWSQQFTGLTSTLRSIHFLDTMKGMAAGDNGVILRTGDGGENWQLMTSGTSATINDFWFADENTGWAVCEDGKILYSSNGGATWSAKQVSTTPLRTIHFANFYHGYAMGVEGKIFKTYDGGDSWNADLSPTSSTLNDLYVENPACAWAVGDAGTIIRLRRGVDYPASVTELHAWSAGPNAISLSWNNPAGAFAGVVIIRSSTGYPATVADGVKIYDGRGEAAADSPLAANTTYYYTAFAYDAAGRYSLIGSTSRVSAKTGVGFDLHGYRVTVSSVDASAFPVVKSFVSVLDSATLEPIAALTAANFSAREDGTVESPISVESVGVSSGAKADIVFVFDTTGSMGDEISGLKERASAFADALAAKGIDYRLALVTYGDTVDKVEDFTGNIATFKGWISGLYASGGGDTKENSLEGLARATTLAYRPVSQRIVILITDADYHQAGESGGGTTTYTTASMIALYKEQRIMCNVVGPDYPQFHQLAGETGGLYYNITGDFQGIIDRLGTVLSSQYVVTYTTHNPARNNTWRNVIITAERGGKGGWDTGRYYIAGELVNVYGMTVSSVSYDRIFCRWYHLAPDSYDGVKIVRKMGGYPEHAGDGTLVYDGKGTWVTDTGLTPETTYYYRAFTYLGSGQVSAASAAAQGLARTWPYATGTSGWTAMSGVTTENLYAVETADSLHVMVAGENGVIARSANGGATWESRPIAAKSIIRDLDFADHTTGWLVGQSAAGAGLSMKSASGGDAWTSWPTTAAKSLYANCMVSDLVGWNVGAQGVIEKTVNGGTTWSAQYGAADKTFYDLDFCNPDTGWVVGDAGVILKTLNGGASWNSQSSGLSSTIRGVVFIDSDWGWAATSDGKVLRTMDGGISWKATAVSDMALHDIDFADHANGCAVGQGGRLYRTGDGGATWSRVESGSTVNLNAVRMTSAWSGWAAGDAGTILRLGGSAAATWKGLEVTVNSVDAEAFPVIKSFVSIIDSEKRTAVTDLTAEHFKVREEGTLQSPIKVELISSGSGARADIVFVFDVTGSMGDEISGLKERALTFADALAAKGIDYRLGLVTFSDTIEEVHDFTADAAEFKAWIDGLRASGGGDTKENALEGLARASKLSFRETTQKMAVLITDAEYHQAGESGGGGTTAYTTETMISLLQSLRIVTHVVGPDLAQFRQLAERSSGLWFNITSDFGGIIDAIGSMLTSQYVITYTTSAPVPDNRWRQVAVVAEREGKGGYDIGRYYIGAARIALTPETVIGVKDAVFDINVQVEGMVNLGLVHFAIAYDAAKVDIESWHAGDFLKRDGAADPILVADDNGTGLLDISITRTGTTSGASGSGTLLTIRFKVLVAECASDIGLNSVQLRQPDNSEIAASSRSAKIQAAVSAGLLGDLDKDLDIDLRDFTLLSGYWQPANDARGDIGPASGSVPALTVAKDGVVNFEDLFVFTRMWNWYQSRPAPAAALGKMAAAVEWRITPLPQGGPGYICELFGENLGEVAMGHLRLHYNPEQLRVSSITAGGFWEAEGSVAALLADHQEREGLLDLALARLADRNSAIGSAVSGPLLRLQVEELGAAGALVDWKLETVDLRDWRGSRLLAQEPAETAIRLSALPAHYALSQNYPNPFNSRTEVHFTVPAAGLVRVAVLNILGQPVRTLVHGRLEAGSYRHIWDGRNESGQEVTSGLYLLYMEAGDFVTMRRMAFVK